MSTAGTICAPTVKGSLLRSHDRGRCAGTACRMTRLQTRTYANPIFCGEHRPVIAVTAWQLPSVSESEAYKHEPVILEKGGLMSLTRLSRRIRSTGRDASLVFSPLYQLCGNARSIHDARRRKGRHKAAMTCAGFPEVLI